METLTVILCLRGLKNCQQNEETKENKLCSLSYDKRFSIVTTARSSFHLNLLEATTRKSYSHPRVGKQQVVTRFYEKRGHQSSASVSCYA